jgi:hypothetical protein
MMVQSIWSKLRAMRNASSKAMLLSLLLAVPILAQQDEPKPQGRESKPDELQTGRKAVKPASTAVMNTQEKPEATPMGGKTLRMEDALKTPPVDGAGKRQMKIDAAMAENPQSGAGEQKPRPGGDAKAVGSHLELVLRVSPTGKAEVVSAKEVPGVLQLADTTVGQWVYAVFSGNKALAARGIADPFEMRSFAPPEGSPLEGQGHHIERAQTALIPVAVPGLTLKSPEVDGLSLQFYRIKPGGPVFHVDPSIFQKLQQEERLEMQFQVPAASLSRQIRLMAAPSKIPPQ